MEGLVKEYVNFLNDDTRPASDKFWEMEKRIKEDKRHPGVIMEMHKIDAILDIVRLIRLKVIIYIRYSRLQRSQNANLLISLWKVASFIGTQDYSFAMSTICATSLLS